MPHKYPSGILFRQMPGPFFLYFFTKSTAKSASEIKNRGWAQKFLTKLSIARLPTGPRHSISDEIFVAHLSPIFIARR